MRREELAANWRRANMQLGRAGGMHNNRIDGILVERKRIARDDRRLHLNTFKKLTETF
jgi:hypothetical protein